MTTEKKLLSIDELSEYLDDKPCKGTIYNWCSQKLIPFMKKGRKSFFNKDEIDDWDQNRTILSNKKK